MDDDAPVGSELLFETDSVRVWDLVVAPGTGTSWHRHRVPYLYIVIQPGKVRTEYEDGTGEDQEDEIGQVVHRSDKDPHRLVNLGTELYRNIVVELKDEGS